MATHHDTQLIEINVVAVKPKYILHFMAHVQEMNKLHEKYGVKILATWISEAGAVHKVFIVSHHASYATRSKFHDEHLTDPEWLKLHKHMSKFITEIHNYVCKPNPHLPMKAFDTKKKIFDSNASHEELSTILRSTHLGSFTQC